MRYLPAKLFKDFFPKLHILAPGVKKFYLDHFWTNFDQFGRLPYRKGKKMHETKKLIHINNYLDWASVFFSFSVRKGRQTLLKFMLDFSMF